MKYRTLARKRSPIHYFVLAVLGLSPLFAHAEAAYPHGETVPGNTAFFSVGMGITMGPVYEGSDDYAALPLLLVKGRLPTERWGTFSGSAEDGLRWDLPSSSSLAFALLAGYDIGRKERVRILGGHNTRLVGMGDLDSSPLVGGEVSWRLSTGRLFVRGMQATNNRTYGGRDLNRTAFMNIGVASDYPVSDVLSLATSVYGTWGDSGYMASRFGVSGEQAAHTTFDDYHIGRGMQDMTLKVGAHWQWMPKVSLEGGMKATALVANARNSPLVDKSVGASLYLGMQYTF
ncbi:MipA/OmpV family protein [Serratia marcescens]